MVHLDRNKYTALIFSLLVAFAMSALLSSSRQLFGVLIQNEVANAIVIHGLPILTFLLGFVLVILGIRNGGTKLSPNVFATIWIAFLLGIVAFVYAMGNELIAPFFKRKEKPFYNNKMNVMLGLAVVLLVGATVFAYWNFSETLYTIHMTSEGKVFLTNGYTAPPT